MKKMIKIGSDIENLRIVEKTIDEISTELGIREDCYGKIMVSAMEAVKNAIVHGNKSDINKIVEINIEDKLDELVITVIDEGNGFNPFNIPDPTKPENIENLSGRGVFLMSRLADSIEFNKTGNMVTMFFKNIKN